jgi:pyruvate/2-oxoglutarate dehydrogenase complex dihydrolipoamide dehydrogenase (E3) component
VRASPRPEDRKQAREQQVQRHTAEHEIDDRCAGHRRPGSGTSAGAQLLGPHLATADSSAVPQVVFTAPEAAGVGRTAEQAEAEGYRIKVVDVDLGATVAGAALYEDDYRGRARMIVDEDRECLLGVGVTELLHSATVALAGEVRIDRLWHAIPSFARSSEAWLRLLEAYRG